MQEKKAQPHRCTHPAQRPCTLMLVTCSSAADVLLQGLQASIQTVQKGSSQHGPHWPGCRKFLSCRHGSHTALPLKASVEHSSHVCTIPVGIAIACMHTWASSTVRGASSTGSTHPSLCSELLWLEPPDLACTKACHFCGPFAQRGHSACASLSDHCSLLQGDSPQAGH